MPENFRAILKKNTWISGKRFKSGIFIVYMPVKHSWWNKNRNILKVKAQNNSKQREKYQVKTLDGDKKQQLHKLACVVDI